jgi:uncharacterized protein YjiS (DUF1127 family)
MSIADLFVTDEASRSQAARRNEVRIAERIVLAGRVVMRRIDRSRQRRALLDLDDRLLAEAGLTRLQAVAEGRKPFWR